MALFSLETGFRESNVTLLRWEQVDLSQGIVYIESDDILKSEKAFVVPLSDIAIDLIKKQIGKQSPYKYTHNFLHKDKFLAIKKPDLFHS